MYMHHGNMHLLCVVQRIGAGAQAKTVEAERSQTDDSTASNCALANAVGYTTETKTTTPSIIISQFSTLSGTSPNPKRTIRAHRRHGALAQRLPLGDALRARQRLATLALERAHNEAAVLHQGGRLLAHGDGRKVEAGPGAEHRVGNARCALGETGQHHVL